MKRFPLLITLVLFLGLVALSCTDQPTAPPDPADPGRAIQDAVHLDGNRAFYWLPPVVKNPSPTGVFNAQLKPRVSVCIVDFDVNPSACDDTDGPVVEWTLATGLKVSAGDEHYGFEWHTDQTVPDYDLTYRIQVFLSEDEDAVRLGYADVQFFSNGSEMKNIDTGEYIALRDGRTLPGRFRIEKGASCNAEADCGEATIGASGGVVTTEAGFAGVAVPAGALDGDILIKIRRVDPGDQPWGDCLPTGLRQEEGCYEFDTHPALSEVNAQDAFNDDVVVAVCIDPAAARPDNLSLHKYDPENRETGVVELASAAEDFLTCDTFDALAYAAPAGLLGRFASAVGRVLAPVTRLVAGRPLYATDAGRGGLTDAFSFIGWAEPATLSLESAAPGFAAPGSVLTPTIHVETRHNHPPDAVVDAPGVTLRIVSTAPSGATVVTSVQTEADGRASPEWTVQNETGQHTLTVSTRREIQDEDEASFVVPDETTLLTLTVGAFAAAGACEDEGETDCIQAVAGPDGETIVTPSGFAGVDIPVGALDGDILITIRRVDPGSQPWEDCLPTGLRQEEGCYEYDTDPAIGAVNTDDGQPFHFFHELVTVAICIDPDAVRKDKLTLHKYDPENPAGGVVELAGATEDFLTCPDDNVISLDPDAGALGRLAWGVKRVLRPVSYTLLGRPLYATDAGRGGLTDAFSFIGWAEPVSLALTTEQSGTGPTDVVVTATTSHDHGVAEPSDGTRIRFEITDPSNNTAVNTVETTLVNGAAEARVTLSTQPGLHNVRVSTQQEILIDAGLIISGVGGIPGVFAAPSIQVAQEWFLVPDPTGVVEDEVEVLPTTGTITGVVTDESGAPVPGLTVAMLLCTAESQLGPDGTCDRDQSFFGTAVATDENGVYRRANLDFGIYVVTVNLEETDYAGTEPGNHVVEITPQNDVAEAAFVARSTGTITGVVTDASGAPVPGLTVAMLLCTAESQLGPDGTCDRDQSFFGTAVATDENGVYRRANLDFGIYVVTVTLEDTDYAGTEPGNHVVEITVQNDVAEAAFVVLQEGPLFGQVITPGAAGSPISGITGMSVQLLRCGEGSQPGLPGTCTPTEQSATLVTNEGGNFGADLDAGLWQIRPQPGTADYPGISPRARTVEVPMIDEKGVGAQFVALIVDQQQLGFGDDANIAIGSESNQMIAQTFTPALSAWITEVRVPVQCGNQAGDDLRVSIQTVDDGEPTGSVVGSSTVVAGGQLPAMADGAVVLQPIPINPVQVTAAVQYALVLSVDGGGECALRSTGPTDLEGDAYAGGDAMFLSQPNENWVTFGNSTDIPFQILVQ